MRHNVERDSIRLHSGNVIVTDPIRIETHEDVTPEIAKMNARLSPIMRHIGEGFIVVRAYDRLDSIVAATETLVFLAHVETISRLIVQIDADESVEFPVRVD